MDPEVRTMVGNHMVPYIYEDFVSHETVRDAFMKMYDMGPIEREKLGNRAMERARKEYSLKNLVKDWDESIENTIEKWKSGEITRWRKTEL